MAMTDVRTTAGATEQTDARVERAVALAPALATIALGRLLLGGIGGHLYAKAFRRPAMGHSR